MQRLIFWVGLIALSLYHIKLADASGAPSVVSNAEIQKVNQKYGMLAANRLKAWQNLVNDAYGKPERLQLSMVNNFFNGAKYMSDEKTGGNRITGRLQLKCSSRMREIVKTMLSASTSRSERLAFPIKSFI
jgi:hypothetical protein